MRELKNWTLFTITALFWGSSFLWIKVALREVGPITLVAFRILFGVVGLFIGLKLTRKKLPRDFKTLKLLFGMALLNPGIAFLLITWSETRIPSSLASILNASVPLFTLLVAHLFLEDEKLEVRKFMGLILGFLGITVLMGDVSVTEVKGALAVLCAAFLYACGGVYSRKYLRGFQPLVQATTVMIFADLLMWSMVPFREWPLHIPQLGMTWLALAWLGICGTCLAFLFYFYLINEWGATRASLVNYAFPVVGVLLGIVILKEPLTLHFVMGAVLVFFSIVLTSSKFFSLKNFKKKRAR